MHDYYDKVEVRPLFNDKEAAAFGVWLKENVRLPRKFEKSGERAAVALLITVEPDGSSTMQPLKVPDKEVLEALQRAVETAPRRSRRPGTINGHPVRTAPMVAFMIP